MLSIVEELRTNRESGARRLESEYKAGLMTLARRLCADEGDAEELVNRTFADVVEGIDDYLEQSAFFGWMCKILENRFAKDMRRKSNQTVVTDGEAVDDAADENGADRIFQGVDAALLRDAIADLPDDMKETLMLRYFMGLPVSRVAKLLSIPEGTVKWRLHCARMILAAKLGAAAKKPGVKALLITLALAALTAVGAAVAKVAAPSDVATAPSPSRSEAEATLEVSTAPWPSVSQASTRDGEGATATTAVGISIRATTQVARVDGKNTSLVGAAPSAPPPTEQENPTMNRTTRSAALGAAAAAIAATASADAFIVNGDPEFDPPAAQSISPATALAAAPGHGTTAADALEARNRTIGISPATSLNGTQYSGFMLILR